MISRGLRMDITEQNWSEGLNNVLFDSINSVLIISNSNYFYQIVD